MLLFFFFFKRTGSLPPGFKGSQKITLKSDSNLIGATVPGSKIKSLQIFLEPEDYLRNEFQVLNLGNIIQDAKGYFMLALY